MPTWSAMKPCITGRMAPPTMAIFRMPDPLPVSGPSSATPRLKMVGNMIELNSPTARMLHIAPYPPISMETESGAEKSSDHSAAPIERNKTGGGSRRKISNLRQPEKVHQKAAYGDLRTHVGEDSDRAQNQVGMPPDGVGDLLARAAG